MATKGYLMLLGGMREIERILKERMHEDEETIEECGVPLLVESMADQIDELKEALLVAAQEKGPSTVTSTEEAEVMIRATEETRALAATPGETPDDADTFWADRPAPADGALRIRKKEDGFWLEINGNPSALIHLGTADEHGHGPIVQQALYRAELAALAATPGETSGIHHTVGDNDALFGRYKIRGTEHTPETEQLCEVIRSLEARPAPADGAWVAVHDLKHRIGMNVAQWAARQEMKVPQKTLVEHIYGVIDEWRDTLTAPSAPSEGVRERPCPISHGSDHTMELQWVCETCGHREAED